MDRIFNQKLNISDENKQIADALGISNELSAILSSRGYDTLESAKKFIYPKLDDLSPLTAYNNLTEVVERIKRAIDNEETVVIYGDYDCDGVCGVAILYNFLASKNANVYYFIPNRHTDGYGINSEALESIAEAYYPDLIISVDCGITSVEEVAFAQEELGIDMIITDHHNVSETLPNCLIFSCKLSDDNGDKNLCGAGVALRLVEAIDGIENSKQYYDIAALATVADVVPLVGDNRIITKFGLMLINSKRNKGIASLVNSCVKGEVKSGDIAYKLAPRINAVGRMGDANEIVNLFIEQEQVFIDNLVEKVNEVNIERQNMTDKLTSSCLEKLKGYDFNKYPIIVLKDDKWFDGVLGITASRLVGVFHRPVLLFTKNNGLWKGSGRSISAINIYECLKASSDYIDKFGGHSQACGLSISDDNFNMFVQSINTYAKQNYSESVFDYEIAYDLKLEEGKDTSFAKELLLLEPFGEGNTQPVFRMDKNNVKFSQIASTEHIKYKKSAFEYVGFNMLSEIDNLNSDKNKTFIVDISYKVFNNIDYTQAMIKDYFVEPVEKFEEYIMTFCGEEISVFKPTCIDIDKAFEILDGGFGTCYIAYFKDSYDKFAKQIKSKNLENKIIINGTSSDLKRGKNTLILSPSAKQDLTYYRKIVYIDKPFDLGFIDNLDLYINAEVYFLENGSKKLTALDIPSYEELGKIFISIKSVINQNFNSFKSIYTEIKENIGITYEKFCICLCTFIDLGIIIYTDTHKLALDKNVRNKLENSVLYKRIAGAII